MARVRASPRRRAAVAGFVVAVFRADYLMAGLGLGELREVAFTIFDGTTLEPGLVELLRQRAEVPPELRPLIDGAATGLQRTIDYVAQLQRVVRVETRDTPVGPALDVERSTASEEAHHQRA